MAAGAASSSSTPDTDDEKKPFYKQTWFFVSVGIIVLLIAMFVGYRMYINSKKKSETGVETLEEGGEGAQAPNVTVATGGKGGNHQQGIANRIAMLTNRMDQKIHDATQGVEMRQVRDDIVSNANAIQNLATQNKEVLAQCREIRNMVLAKRDQPARTWRMGQ